LRSEELGDAHAEIGVDLKEGNPDSMHRGQWGGADVGMTMRPRATSSE
jgi:hypothetical protein